eukprot:TRINITY_DN2496_c0_g1_i1.p1 TRINITY_DN2496_c0_g1~~TRINITY_DN2496_c0_g1_i1.p1  ORF type:complete len:173 (-),score=19.78 TRINITY_DN2496_c0_g1_i1:24-542(-)
MKGAGLIAVVLALCTVNVVAHLCIIYPHQRGEMDVSSGGNPSCYRPIPECGNRSAEEPQVTWHAGQTVKIHFQQNYNHWYPQNPGWLDAALVIGTNVTKSSHFIYLGNRIPDWNANNMATQTNFTITATIPDISCDHCVLRVRYVSNNADEIVPNNPIAAFYQCADVRIKRQ